jgi:hypothetical protein
MEGSLVRLSFLCPLNLIRTILTILLFLTGLLKRFAVAMDDLTSLQSSCIFLMHTKDILTIDRNAPENYVLFQAKFGDRIMKLRAEGPQRKPKEPNGNICMPPIYFLWNRNLNIASKQAPSTKDSKQSCCFDKARIADYERANTAFKKQIQNAYAPDCCKAFSELLIMDIAHLTSSTVN